MWPLFAILSALLAAIIAIFAKIGMGGIDSDLVSALRTIIILILASGIVFAKCGVTGIYQLSKQNWLFLALSGLATGRSWIFYIKAMQAGRVSQVAPIDKLSLPPTLLPSAVILGQAITWKMAVGAALNLGGTIIIIR